MQKKENQNPNVNPVSNEVNKGEVKKIRKLKEFPAYFLNRMSPAFRMKRKQSYGLSSLSITFRFAAHRFIYKYLHYFDSSYSRIAIYDQKKAALVEGTTKTAGM